MTDTRYNRWQGYAIAQLSVAVALISGLSLSGLAVALSLLQNKDFTPGGNIRLTFTLSFPLFIFAALSSSGAVISRTLDFRLTARKVRKEQKPEDARKVTMFGLGPDCYGCITWSLFWCACIALLAGVILLMVSVGATYRARLW